MSGKKSSNAGRPSHNAYESLGFTPRTSIDEKGKKIYSCKCWECGSWLFNTAVDRLQIHRKKCILSLEKMKLYSSNDSNPSVGHSIINKRKASHSLATSENDIIIIEETSPLVIASSTSSVDILQVSSSSKVVNQKNSKQQKKLKPFLDEVTDNEENIIYDKLLKFLVASNLNFKAIDSKYFLDLIKSLRPAFADRLVKSDVLRLKIFPEVYQKIMNVKADFKSSEIVLIHCDKEKNLLSVTFNEEGKYFFLKSSPPPKGINAFTLETLEILKVQCNTVATAVISNTEFVIPFEIDSFGDDDYYKLDCASLLIEKACKEIADVDFLLKCDTLIGTFDIESLKDQFPHQLEQLDVSDYRSYLISLKACYENLENMREIIAKRTYKCDAVSLSILFDDKFESNLKEIIVVLEAFNHMLEQSSNIDYGLADYVNDWIRLFDVDVISENYQHILKRIGKNCFHELSLAAYYFHPRYDTDFFTDLDYYKKLVRFLVDQVSAIAMKSFFNLRDKSGIFSKLFAKSHQNSYVFWNSVETEAEHVELSQFALRILKIPAFTYQKNFKFSELTNSDQDEVNNLKKLYYYLKVNE